ncbi:hypothetical protein VNO78_03071 [Psophocarpus tetragonolobus]|uniref:No apical meristem-associated C-terminal domain-containing protein n=1 Tax=Psophocarpus tetragonolobus TaxID=3891 RepID=A0AAN9SZZ9_PSOTE
MVSHHLSILSPSLTRLCFNSTNGQIIASDDKWKKLCEKYKSAKQFKRKGCLHYDKICVIFGDTTASGVNQHPSTKIPSISDGDNSEGDDFDQEEQSSQTRKKARVSSDSRKRKSRENFPMTFANALTTMSESSKRKADILERMSTSQVVGSSFNATVGEVDEQNDEDKMKLMTCLSTLEKLEGIGDAPFTKAVKAFIAEPAWRDVFLAVSDERKKDLLLLKYNRTQDIIGFSRIV